MQLVALGRKKNSIARVAIPNRRHTVGFGYIVIPSDVDRDKYVKNCFRVNLVDILTEDSEFIQDVKLDKGILQLIEFPQESGKLGSLVVYINEKINNQPFIVATIAKTDEYEDLREHEFSIKKSFNGNVTLLRGVGDKGKLFLNLISDSDEINGIFIDIKSPSGQGVFDLEVQGNIDLKVSKKILLNVKESIEGIVEKDVTLEAKEDINLKAKKFEIVNSDDYSVKDLFDDIITQISAITVQTALGQMPILNKVQVEELKNSVAKIFK